MLTILVKVSELFGSVKCFKTFIIIINIIKKKSVQKVLYRDLISAQPLTADFDYQLLIIVFNTVTTAVRLLFQVLISLHR